MAHGICKIKNGCVYQDSVWVEYDNGKRFEIPANLYRVERHKPSVDQLPECKGEQDAPKELVY